ncbi:MAG: adenosylhomocysteinase [Candidatus Coatesbacteria bacterium]|nr:MAG: adenosylhomocysteinase [Candidatus Coatesbacteria bacterium]
MNYDIKDISLAEAGKLRIDWARMKMPVLDLIKARFEKERPFEGMTIGACLHVTTETANLMDVLKAGGATVGLCASNPLSTQDDVTASIVEHLGMSVFAIHAEDKQTYYKHIHSVLDMKPVITIDDGADLVSTLHKERQDLLPNIIGGMEETTTGVIRLRSLAKNGALKVPMIAVNDADTKHLFDNRYGTGQSTMDGIMRATNRLVAGTDFVVCGYGWCGRGAAMRAKGLGARVIITEVDPVRALEAAMDGFRVMPMSEAAKIGDFFLTATGDIKVIAAKHFEAMKDGAIVCNTGHFNVEIDIEALDAMAVERRGIRRSVEEFKLEDGRRIYLLADGRLVNLSAAEGHPSSVMDMSFANQALCAEYLVKNKGNISIGVHEVPKEIDDMVASSKLATMGISIDTLTEEQRAYLAAWEMGT